MAVERKDLRVPYEWLAERGFERLPAGEALGGPAHRDLRQWVEHPLNHLDDIRSSYMRFAEFDDEMVPFRKDGQVLDLFATSTLTRFLFVRRRDGRVFQHIDWRPDGEGATFEQINSSLAQFVRCFCREHAISLRRRSNAIWNEAGQDRKFDAEAAVGEAEELRSFIAAVDEPALRSVYWSTVIYEFEEGFYQSTPTLLYLTHKGRWPVDADE